MPIKRVTSQDVAERAGVSRTTVSFVLNEVEGVQISDETRQRVLQAARELGYVPDAAAQALASRRSKIIGLVLTRDPHHIASDAFLTQILDSLVQVVRRHGLRLLLDIVEDTHQVDTYLHLVRAKRIDGIIFSGPRFDDDALQALEKEGFPVVLMGQLPGTNFFTVDVDNRGAAMKAVNHLLQLGHTQIACITNAPPSFTSAADRLQGYRDALERAGIPFSLDLVRHGDFDPESGYRQMQSLLSTATPPTAAFIASDVVAFGALAALREHGLNIPQEIAVVGFDDVPLSRYVDPPLTTVHLPATQLAQRACEMLIQLILGERPETRHMFFETNLVIRASCGAQPAFQQVRRQTNSKKER